MSVIDDYMYLGGIIKPPTINLDQGIILRFNVDFTNGSDFSLT